MNQVWLKAKWLVALIVLSGLVATDLRAACPDTPEAPTEVTVINYLGSRVQLRWKNGSVSGVTGKTQYDIYRNGVKVDSVDYVSGTYQYAYAPVPMPGATYTYQVTVRHEAGCESGLSGAVSAVVPGP